MKNLPNRSVRKASGYFEYMVACHYRLDVDRITQNLRIPNTIVRILDCNQFHK